MYFLTAAPAVASSVTDLTTDSQELISDLDDTLLSETNSTAAPIATPSIDGVSGPQDATVLTTPNTTDPAAPESTSPM